MFKNYVLIALRNIYKYKGYSFIKIFGLAVGMACCILIFLWVQNEMGFDRFHEKSDRLYRVISHMDEKWSSSSPWMLPVMLKKDFPEIEKSTTFNNRTMLIHYADKTFYESIGFVAPDFLEMFSFPLIDGEPNTALAALNSVLVSEETAQKYFGGEKALGQTITMNNSQQLTITGVFKNIPAKSSFQFDLLAPIRLFGEDRIQTWYLETSAYVLVKENTSVDDLKAKIAGTTMKYDKRIKDKIIKNDLQALTHIHLYGLNDIGSILYVYIFSIIAAIVLIIACINFINLTTAKATNRAREVGMRKVVGASRIKIAQQFFGESFLLSIVAMIFSILMVEFFLPTFNNLTRTQLSFNLFQNSFVIIALLSIVLVVGILSGSYPALLLSSFKPIKVLQESVASGVKNPLFRRVLVIFQFAITVILIISSIVIKRQLDYIHNKDLGFNRNHVIRLSINSDIRNNYDTFKERLLQNPNILNVTAANNTPTNVGNINPVYWEGRGPDQYETMNFVTVDYDYFETFEMEMAKGRSFSRDFSTDNQNYIINQAAVEFSKLDEPIGKNFSIWTNEGQIVGVVKNIHSRSLHNEMVPIVFALTKNWPHTNVFIRLNPNEVQNTITSIEKVWQEYAGTFPFVFEFLSDVFEQQYQFDQQVGKLFAYFTFLAIFISCLGLLGLAAFTAEQRTKEIGIRKVLGASISNIITLISREFLILLIVANVIAWPIAYFIMNKMMNNYAYRTDLALWVFFASGMLALFIATFAVGFQAIRAARTNPAKSLKYE